MPIKFEKNVTTHLFKFVKKVSVSFNRKLKKGCRCDAPVLLNCLLIAYAVFSVSLSLHRHAALDVRSVSARETWRQVTAVRFKAANPKAIIQTNVNLSPKPPRVEFTFIDDTVEAFETEDLIAKDILFQVWLKANNLSCEYEMEGKSVDDSM
jgi:hypothetical protein